MLRQYSAIIDLSKYKLFPKKGDLQWTTELISSDERQSNKTMYHIQKYQNTREQTPNNGISDETDNEQLWHEKIEEIRTFQREKTNAQLTVQQAEQLIDVYNRYRHVFSDTPGKVRDYYQCEFEFREPVNFNKKSYPIAFCLLYTSRCV